MNFEEINYNWNSFLSPYFLAAKELELKFNSLRREYTSLGEYSPIQYVHVRVKSFDSILAKMEKYHVGFKRIGSEIHDIVGVRIVSQFEEDLMILHDLIQNRSDMSVVNVKDYFTHPKASGYKSIHLIIEYNVNTSKGKQTIIGEIQLRTLAMDFWATIEHSLNYKYSHDMPTDLKNRLSLAARSVSELDREMGQIREEIMEAQKSLNTKTTLHKTIVGILDQLSKYKSKDEINKYFISFDSLSKEDNAVQLKLLQKELENELKSITNNISGENKNGNYFK